MPGPMFSGGILTLTNPDGSQVTFSVLAGYAAANQESGTPDSYFGFLDADGDWYIIKASVAGAITTYLYAVGTSGYASAWTNRTSQSYDTFDAKF